MICDCGYEFEDSCGIYGCPNCLGESIEETKMSKQIQDMFEKYPEKFESWHREDNGGPDYWIYCRAPYYSPDMETQTIHEYTVKAVLEKMKSVVAGRYNGYGWGPPV